MNPVYDDVLRNVGKKLFDQRRLKNEKLATVAKELNVSQATMSKIENGNYKLSIEFLCKVAHFYKVDVKELLEDK